MSQSFPDDLQAFLHELNREMHAAANWGIPASYIPELADVDPAQFAISVALADGRMMSAGAHDRRFSIQSVSKVFTLAAALGRIGDTLLWLPPVMQEVFFPWTCDRVRSSVRPLYAAFSVTAGRDGDQRNRSKSMKRACRL